MPSPSPYVRIWSSSSYSSWTLSIAASLPRLLLVAAFEPLEAALGACERGPEPETTIAGVRDAMIRFIRPDLDTDFLAADEPFLFVVR